MFASAFCVHAIVFASRIAGVMSLPHFGWMMPVACVILIWMMFAFFLAGILD
jgi:hypothetical protein